MTSTTVKKSLSVERGEVSRREQALLGGGTILVALLAWQVLATTGVLPADAFPSAVEVFGALIKLLATSTAWIALGHTLLGALIGLASAFGISIVLGIAMGRLASVNKSTFLVVEFLKPIPPVALLPLALLFYGPTLIMKCVLVTFGALWPLLIQISHGARTLDPTLGDVSASYQLSWKKQLLRVYMPQLTPHMLVGLRIATSIAIVVAIVAELIGGVPGLGQQIALAQTNGILDEMYAYIVITGVLGLAANGAFALVSKPLLFWHSSVRGK